MPGSITGTNSAQSSEPRTETRAAQCPFRWPTHSTHRGRAEITTSGSVFGAWESALRLAAEVTIPINLAGVPTVYTLADNTYGCPGCEEFDITFTPASGAPITYGYFGDGETKDYNLNCGTTGCDTTTNASYWFIDGNRSYPGDGQWLQLVGWSLPSNFGTLDSITFTQVNGVDGAILAGVTVQTTPEQASVLLLGACLAAVAFLMRRRLVR